MKKILCTILSVCLTLTVFMSTPVSAKEVRFLSAFGDSISKGYGLSHSYDNFVNKVAEDYLLNADENFFNFSVNGATSSDILLQIKQADSDIVKNSDTIIISAGGNDIIGAFSQKLYQAAQTLQSDFADVGINVSTGNYVDLLTQIATAYDDPDKYEVLQKLNDLCTSEQAVSEYNSTVSAVEQNLVEMISYISDTGSQADIYILTVYDPTSVIPMGTFSDVLTDSIKQIQQSVFNLQKNESFGDKIHVVDVLSDFDGQYASLTNILALDIHPNKDGHQRIYSLIKSDLDSISEPEPSEVSNDTSDTSEQSETDSSVIEDVSSDISETSAELADSSEIVSSSSISSSADVSSADSQNQNPTAYILIAGAVVILLIAAFFVIRAVRKKH